MDKNFTKKWLTITAGIAISGGLLILITNQFSAEKQEDVWLDKNSQSNELVVDTPEKDDEKDETSESNLQIPSISGTEAPTGTSTPAKNLTDSLGNELESHPDSNVNIPEAGTMNGDDKGTSQTIQPDVASKPTYSQSQLTDPTQTPSGGSVTVTDEGEIIPDEVPETPKEPEPTPEPEVYQPTTSNNTTSSNNATTNTNTSTKTESDAYGAYVPGFGYIPYNDTPNVGVQATDMYENGNKVGNM